MDVGDDDDYDDGDRNNRKTSSERDAKESMGFCGVCGWLIQRARALCLLSWVQLIFVVVDFSRFCVFVLRFHRLRTDTYIGAHVANTYSNIC